MLYLTFVGVVLLGLAVLTLYRMLDRLNEIQDTLEDLGEMVGESLAVAASRRQEEDEFDKQAQAEHFRYGNPPYNGGRGPNG